MCTAVKDKRFSNLHAPDRIWAVPAIHGDIDRLTAIHDAIFEHIQPRDRLVYLGNYTGHGDYSAECVDEILTYRRLILSKPGMLCSDLVYLRGQQEEMWQKLLQLQFAPDPTSVLLWMLGNGLSQTLYSYGLSPHDGIEACRSGIMVLTKWTNTVREAVRKRPGHDIFATQLVRASHTAVDQDYPMLFVHAGLNDKKSLEEQGDHLWWGSDQFQKIEQAYQPFAKVVRGYDPEHKGLHMNCVTATLDDGCGFGGNLVCAAFSADGSVFKMLEA